MSDGLIGNGLMSDRFIGEIGIRLLIGETGEIAHAGTKPGAADAAGRRGQGNGKGEEWRQQQSSITR